MNNITSGLTAEAKGNMLANLQIELNSRIEKLRAQCEAQCASMQSRLERRVNRIPVVTRQTTLANLLKASAPVRLITAPAPPTKVTDTTAITTTTTTTAATKKTVGTGTAGRKPRNAVPSAPSSRPASSPEVRIKSTSTNKTINTKAVPTYAKATKTARAKKRSSDELSGEDKENSELPVPKKRTRNVAPKAATEKVEKAEKTTTTGTTRSTRAGSRTKPAGGHVLSPKTNAANVRKPAPAARSVRPR
ncbi:hypothetical protein GGP41_005315 [Bipolaris sorokiniana]|uniref:Borealin N-terminal domain-containing protein n=2 Tax=Cochliobolus sativus TaxID=45130 RepID=A0A8H5ZKG8_COCSA|nr:uncharacterized protein COCSADRAFT_200899 [Bipolaris sorokiniana ND90Pr]EMD63314.1 hypothetical protein COCSADRAFT_200899 [Bipolaris sorokiniana ND90Pr]KAF5849874.1 hypothetical protein GGP41_005315 [Bipolaris sorokiniana]